MRLLIDMNLSPGWVQSLRADGIDATHWSTIGRANADDRTLMSYARENAMVVFTHDLDFGAILAATGAAGPSVIQLRTGDVRPAAAGAAIVQAIRQFADELEHGTLLTVDPHRFRVSMLPLGDRGGR